MQHKDLSLDTVINRLIGVIIMGWGYRKSIKLGKGTRLNISKRGVGVSTGVKGFRVGTGPSGSRMRATLPGTGLYYEKRLNTNAGKKKSTSFSSKKNAPFKNSLVDQVVSGSTEIEEYEDLIHLITTIHVVPVQSFDWALVYEESPPFSKDSTGPNEQSALEKLNTYKPSLLDKLFSRTEARKRILTEEIPAAKLVDQGLINDWNRRTQLAKQVLSYEKQALINALRELTPFQNLLQLGSMVSAYATEESHILNVEFNVNEKAVIPYETKSLTKTGKVSTRKMGIGRRNELLYMYVTGGALEIAKESFAVLPIDSLFVHCIDTRLNLATGIKEENVLLSVLFTRDQLDEIQYEFIDPGEAIQSFLHHMKFLKTKGFQPVSRLEGN